MLLCEDDGSDTLASTFPFRRRENVLGASGQKNKTKQNPKNWNTKRTDYTHLIQSSAKNKVKRTIYINYQNIHVTETKASVCLSLKRWQ